MFCRPLTECGTNLYWLNFPPTNYLPLFLSFLVDRTSFAMLDKGTVFDFQVDKRSLLDFKIDRSLFDFQGETVTVRLSGKQTVTVRLPGRQTSTSKHRLPNIDVLRSTVVSPSLLLILTGDPPKSHSPINSKPLTLFSSPSSTSTNYHYFVIYHVFSFPLSFPFLVFALVLLFLYPNKKGTTQKINAIQRLTSDFSTISSFSSFRFMFLLLLFFFFIPTGTAHHKILPNA